MSYTLYIAAKFISYFLWCYLAIDIFKSEAKDKWGYASKLAFGRLGIGLLAGFPMVLAYGFLMSKDINIVVVYFLSFILFRFFEWSILLGVSNLDIKFTSAITFQMNIKQNLWLVGGVLISCLLDGLHMWAIDNTNIKFFC